MTDIHAERSYLSIGEVLDLLKDDFPDITISKIRFLESRGLLDPERTPSGYRKFYEEDVARLRWILTQQKDHFLPLKVIKGRLESGDDATESLTIATQPIDAQPTLPTLERDSFPGSIAAEAAAVADHFPADPDAPPVDHHEPAPAGPGGVSGSTAGHSPPSAPPAKARRRAKRPVRRADALGSAGELTLEEMAAATGADVVLLNDLVRFALVAGREVGGQTYFDGDATETVRLAVALATHGIEARHLRGFKVSVEREAGLYEQVVLPYVRQRDVDATTQAGALIAELTRLGGEMREVLLRQALRSFTDPR